MGGDGAFTRGWRFVGERWYLRALLGAALVSGILALVIAWIEWGGTPTDQRVALTFLINLVAVIAFQVWMGNSGVPTFGHVGFMAIGAYTAALVTTPTERKMSETLIPNAPDFILNAQFGLVPSLIIGVAVAMIVAALVGVVIVRLRGGSAAIATLALLIIIRTVIGNWEEITRGPKTWSGIPGYTTVWVALGFAIAAIFIARFFRDSGVGLRLRATRTDELASSAVGVDLSRSRLASWVLSAGIAGAAGVLWAHYFLSLSPQTFFFDLTFLYIVMVIIGGPSVSGAVIGTAVVTLVQEFLRRFETGGIHIGPLDFDEVFGLTPIVLGLIVLIVVIKRPEGVLGRWELDEVLERAMSRLRAWRQNRALGPPLPAGGGANGLTTTDHEGDTVGARPQREAGAGGGRAGENDPKSGGERK